MGIFNPFSYWPLAPTKGNSADDTTETAKDQPGNSWEIVDSDQKNANATSLTSIATTLSPAEPTAPNAESWTGNRLSLRPKLSLDTSVGRPARRHAEQQRQSPKQSWRGSKRLTGLKTILRVRKGQEQLRQQFPAESSLMDQFPRSLLFLRFRIPRYHRFLQSPQYHSCCSCHTCRNCRR